MHFRVKQPPGGCDMVSLTQQPVEINLITARTCPIVAEGVVVHMLFCRPVGTAAVFLDLQQHTMETHTETQPTNSVTVLPCIKVPQCRMVVAWCL